MAPLSRVAVLALAAALLLQAGVATAALPAEHPPRQVADGDSAANTTLLIELEADGDAEWTVTMTVELADDSDVAAFRSVGNAFENGSSDVLSLDTFRSFADRAGQATGRDMTVGSPSREATIDNGTGQLELTFTWLNFGRRDGDSLHLDDAFESPNGTWLDGLSEQQRLVIRAPDSFAITSAPKGFTNRTIRWSGPIQFEPSYFSITYEVATTSPTTTATATPTVTSTATATPTTSVPSGTPVPPTDNGGNLALFGFLLLIVAGAVFIYLLQRDGLPTTSVDHGDEGAEPPAERDDGAEDDDADETDGPADERSGPAAASESVEDDVGESHEGDVGDGDEQAPLPDRELLSDEEYVEALIERNGGRMKQANIVEETGWSNAKVSQLLSTMAEDGHVEKLRIGRENLISFPDDDGDEN